MCVGRICRYAPVCNGDGDCDAVLGECVDGRCAPGCNTTDDCGGGQTACSEGECVFRCSSDETCDTNEVCSGGVCVGVECEGTGLEGCPDGERCDGTGRCEPYDACTDSMDCPDAEVCVDGICEPATGCTSDLQCEAGLICEAGTCIPAADCDGPDDCQMGEDCIGGLCVPELCRGNEDCADGEFCEEGFCVEFEEPSEITDVIILTTPGAVVPGQEIVFRAIALDGDGEVVVGQSFDFTSDATDVGDFSGDLFTAGDTAGVASITATPAGAAMPVSDPVLVTNLGPALDTTRVAVVDRLTGTAIEGATVTDGSSELTTDAAGVAEFPSVVDGEIHIFAEGYNYVTITEASALSILVTLGEASGSGSQAGFTGDFDFSEVTANGDTDIGLAGAAIAGNLVDVDLASLLGDNFVTSVSIPGVGGQDIPLPGGLVINVGFFGVGELKGTVYALSDEEVTFGWGLGGRVSALELFELFQGGGGGGNIGDFLGILLPLFEAFQHDLQVIETERLPLVVDEDDIDGDGDDTELIADYDNFPDDITMVPEVQQALRTNVAWPDLPVIEGEQTTIAVLVGGVVVEGVGFVPTGISAAQGPEDGGTPEDTTLRMAPSYGGLGTGDYAVLAITFGTSGAGFGGDGITLPRSITGQMFVGARIPEDVDFTAGFPELSETATWDADTGMFSGDDVGGDLYRVTIVGPELSWEVWTAGGGAPEFTLGTAPMGFDDLGADTFARVESLHTDGGPDYDEMISVEGPNLSSLNRSVSRFGRYEIRE